MSRIKLILLLATIGLANSLYLFCVEIFGTGIMPGWLSDLYIKAHPLGAINGVLGVPFALLGFGGMLVVIVLVYIDQYILAKHTGLDYFRPFARSGMTACCVVGSVISLYAAYIAIIVIGHVCPLCAFAWVLMWVITTIHLSDKT